MNILLSTPVIVDGVVSFSGLYIVLRFLVFPALLYQKI